MKLQIVKKSRYTVGNSNWENSVANRFVAVDVETANADLSTICQIGLVLFEDGKQAWKWESLVDPEDFFDGWNVMIHGITEEDVAGKPQLGRSLS